VTKVSVIIPTLNSVKNIKTCLDKVCGQDFPLQDMEVIIVDGFSLDGTDKIIEAYMERVQNPRIKMYQLKEKNIAAARNLGISESSGGIIVFLDSDCFPVSKNWLRNLVEMKGNEEIVHGRIIMPKDTIARRFVRTLDQMGTPDFGSTDIYDSLSKSIFFPTTNVAIRRGIFNRIGLLDETVGSSREDFDFGLRARLSRIIARYASRAIVIHQHRGSLVSLWKWSYGSHKISAGLLRKYSILGRFNLPLRLTIALPFQTTIITFATAICLMLTLLLSFPLFTFVVLLLYLILLLRFVLKADRVWEAFLYPFFYAVNNAMKSFGTLHAIFTLIRKDTNKPKYPNDQTKAT